MSTSQHGSINFCVFHISYFFSCIIGFSHLSLFSFTFLFALVTYIKTMVYDILVALLCSYWKGSEFLAVDVLLDVPSMVIERVRKGLTVSEGSLPDYTGVGMQSV